MIDQAWKGRFFSTRGSSAFRRGEISLLTIALEFLALLLICGERGTPLSKKNRNPSTPGVDHEASIFFAVIAVPVRNASTH
jgi:hypothetical protein